jgi:cytochrome c nitrite reductase small subunit
MFATIAGRRTKIRSDTLKRRNIWVIVGVAVVVVIIAGVAGWNYHEQPQFCAICHIMQPYLESWESPPLLAYAHAEENVTCLECHEPTIQQQMEEGIKFVTNDYENPLEEREFDQEWCLRCHEHGSYEELAQRTEELELNPHDSHYGEMECSICHRVHEASEEVCAYCHDPIATGPGWTIPTQLTTEFLEWWYPDMDCAFCHVSYTESMQDATLLAYGHAQEELVCLDCHELAELEQVHEEAKVGTTEVKPLEISNEFCFGCHVPNEHTSYEEIIKRTEDYTVGDQKINPHVSEGGEIECSSCHSMHKESPTGSSKDACLLCHGSFDELISATANYTWPEDEKKTSPHRYVPHDSKNIPECIYCHEPHPVPLTSTEGLPEPNPQFCYSCHHEQVLECGTCH